MTKSRIAAVGLAAAGALLAAWLLWPEGPQDDEARIRAAIEAMADRAAAKDANGILEHVSETYRGEGGDKRELKRFLLGWFFRSEVVGAIPARVEVAPPQGDRARATLVVILARTPAKRAEDVRPDEVLGSHHLDAEFVREGDAWRVATATRRDATPADLLR